MKNLRLGAALLASLGIATSVFVGCGSSVVPGADEDAAADTGVSSPDVSVPDASVPDTSSPDARPDATVDATVDASVDASVDSSVDATVDATVDASPDAADAADAAPTPCGVSGGRLCALGEACVLDGDCASPNVCEAKVCAAEPAVRTMADIVDLASFDFEGTTLVYTVGNPSVYSCTLPGCDDAAAIPNITQSTMTGRPFPISVAGGFVQYPAAGVAGSTFTVAASRSLDGAVAGPSATFMCVDRLNRPTEPLVRSSHSGADGWSGLYKCITDERGVGGFRYGFASIAGATRLDRVGRGSPSKHSNGDATVRLVPGTQTVTPTGGMSTRTELVSTVLGTIPWGLSENPAPPTELVTSPKSFGGVDLAHPAVGVRQGQTFGVIRSSAPGRMFNLGTGATTISVDERYLYVGKATGLGRCELSEIGTLNTCTLAPMSSDSVEAPLYVSATHAWYKSGTRVRRVAK